MKRCALVIALMACTPEAVPASPPPIAPAPIPEPPAPSVVTEEHLVSVEVEGAHIETTVIGDGRHRMVLLHGYGGDGPDLFPLARALVASAAMTVATPTAPRPWAGGGAGRAWFERRAPDLEAQIDRALVQIEAVMAATDADIVVGFSQGASLALEVGLRRAEAGHPIDAVVALSGRALARSTGRWEALAGVPTFVSHGRADAIIPFSSGESIAREAERGGARVTFVPFSGAHEIPPEVDEALVAFLRALP